MSTPVQRAHGPDPDLQILLKIASRCNLDRADGCVHGEGAASALCVIRPGADGLRVHRHLIELGARRIDYLFPDETHDTIDRVQEMFGPAPCADFLIPVLEDWWARGPADVRIGLFWDLARAILGGDPAGAPVGGLPHRCVFADAGGEREGVDAPRVCGPGLCTNGLDVMHDDCSAIYERSALPRAIAVDGPALPAACAACPEATTCGGGSLPHRYSAARGFDNPTVWCEDMRRLLGRMRALLRVDPAETRRRRAVLEEPRHGV